MIEPGDQISIAPLGKARLPGVGAHLERSRFWSNHVDAIGPTAIIYGALELRLGIESALIQLLIQVRGDELNDSDLRALRSARAIQARIHQLEGHQLILDRKWEFFQILLRVAGAPRFPLARLNVGGAFAHWQKLSEVCHFVIEWNEETSARAIEVLGAAENFLEPLAQAMLVWPKYRDELVQELERKYINDEVSSTEVVYAMEERGVWGLVTNPDGSRHFANDLWGEGRES